MILFSGDNDAGGETGIESSASTQRIVDKTETNLMGLRRTIYLTIQSSLGFEECAHKLLKMDIKDDQIVSNTLSIVVYFLFVIIEVERCYTFFLTTKTICGHLLLNSLLRVRHAIEWDHTLNKQSTLTKLSTPLIVAVCN